MTVYIVRAGCYGAVETVDVRTTLDGAKKSLAEYARDYNISSWQKHLDEWDGSEDLELDDYENANIIICEIMEATQ